MRRVISYILILSVLIGCIDQVNLPIRTEEPRLVVEGQITNEAPPYTVRLTYTGKYGGPTGQNVNDQYVKEAQVSLADDQGHSTGFRAIGQGIYQTTDLTFRGQIGRAYRLSVVMADGKRYLSTSQQMPDVPVIDSLYVQLGRTEIGLDQYFFRFYAVVKDPANQRNYYRWLAKSYGVIRCGDYNWVPTQNTEVNIASDDYINGNRFDRFVIKSPIYSTGPHFVEVKQYAITQESYQFWLLYQQQNARTGSIFDPLPAPVIGNLVNADDPTDKARGFFDVYASTIRRIRYYDTKDIFRPGVQSFIASINQSGVLCTKPGQFPLRFDPPGF
ncbi:DUF4249 family protein [Spirosoma sp. HMF3257]|uniref:DUF4249 domain-containing protein n=1 Tax=Spirosoma telluris TaxID=2183553 RepID=A0A327NJZ0_9BACT|nr:DUF4249 family protein [Spirosoma telluris]RAI75482.1 DUF4249 domain-containing protein [Spirosoma telluris]